jgi:hypothetical protein
LVLVSGGTVWPLIAQATHDDTPPSLPFCTYEDGNASGQPCMWVDPDTGATYRVESENYR